MRSTGEGSPVGQVLAGLAAVNGADVVGLSDGQLRSEILDLVRAMNQLTAALAERIGTFDVRDLARSDGQQASSTWLVNFGLMSKGAALGWLARGRLLRALPALAAGMRDGTVSAEQLAKVAELARHIGVGNVAPYDEILAALCAAAGPVEVGRACERIAALVDPDGADPDGREAFDRRELTFAQVGQSLYVRGRLDPDGAATVQAAIDALLRPPGPGDERSAAQRRADALVDLARVALAGATLPSVGLDRPHVGLLITPEILFGASESRENPDEVSASGCPQQTEPVVQRRAAEEATGDAAARLRSAGHDVDRLAAAGVPQLPDRPWLSWVGEVSRELAQRYACDGVIWRAILDPRNGQPLDVGRRYRIVPNWMRRALWARDHGCRWPGCDTPTPWTDAHHVIPWWPDGTTDIKRLLSLCRYHHGLVHEGRWRIHLDHATGEVSVTRPDGRPYELGPSRPWATPSHQAPRVPAPGPGHETTDPPWPEVA